MRCSAVPARPPDSGVPAAASSAGEIARGLDGELSRLEEFVALLQHEQELLKRGEPEPLLALIDSKNGLANTLAGLAQARERQLADLGLPAGRSGMENWLNRSGQAEDRRRWTRLLELAGQARDLNALNGRLIGLHMQHNQQALAALTAAANKVTTYGPDGQQQAAVLGGRSFGKA